MRTLLRSGALIESWFDMLTSDQRATARALHAAVTAAAPQLHPTVRWGNLVYQLDGVNAVAIVPHKSHVNLQLFKGAALAAQYTQLEGGGKGVRYLKLRTPQAVDAELIARIVQDALDVLHTTETD
jgi:hypothetical protein